MSSVFCAYESERALAADIGAVLAGFDGQALERFLHDWHVWARPDQIAPDPAAAPWRTWLILGGRGAGKTRAGAEWIRAEIQARAGSRPIRIALVGETKLDVRQVMIEGVSGLIAVHRFDELPQYEAATGQLVWPGRAIAQTFSAEDPDGLRGPQFDVAWCDELAKWRHPERTWDMLQFALRLGDRPQVVATTTPRPIPLLQRLIADASTITTRTRTIDNADNLAPSFIAEMQRRYAGTALGRQELDGELIEETSGALWRAAWIEEARVAAAPELARIVVALDPPVTAHAGSDACGLVIAGRAEDGRAYVLADRTLKGCAFDVWAAAAIAAYRDFKADRIVAEVNQGGDLVEGVMRQIDRSVPIRKVSATRGKWLRAEPVAALYAQGRVSHVGVLAELEAEMLAFGADGSVAGRSPDRVDALVWALTELMLDEKPLPAVRIL